MPPCAHIGVGSNLGDRRANCLNAIAALDRCPGIRVTAVSRLYLTEPVDFADQAWFVNAAVRVETVLEPLALLGVLRGLERQAGRRDGGRRYGPRILDLDILLFDQKIVAVPDLEIPHPRLHQRRFVLRPLCDIDPDVIHPVLGIRLARLLEALAPQSQQVMDVPCDC
jgi:2-amino-4-hydroxy-6-hydroxymethyldihydropteridine diphosphokinase